MSALIYIRMVRVWAFTCALASPCMQSRQVEAVRGGLARAAVQNSNPNYAAIREYGRIEWHGETARLIAAGSRPLDMTALTISSCLGVPVSYEDPHYRNLRDLLDVTAPQWSAQHPGSHAYAGRPGKVEVTFDVLSDGSPRDLAQLLEEATRQVNQQLPYDFIVLKRVLPDLLLYSFVPTKTRNGSGELVEVRPYLDSKITIPQQKASIAALAALMSQLISTASGYHFSCCQSLVAGIPWGGEVISYGATQMQAREILEHLVQMADPSLPGSSYSLRCRPVDNRFCFIDARRDQARLSAPDGVCTASGYDGY